MLKRLAILIVPVLILGACTTDQRHAGGRFWTHNECNKEIGRTDRDACNAAN